MYIFVESGIVFFDFKDLIFDCVMDVVCKIIVFYIMEVGFVLWWLVYWVCQWVGNYFFWFNEWVFLVGDVVYMYLFKVGQGMNMLI